ncbi:MAG: aldehyde dehydrogenase family protein [Phycisphaeraceae bacterium]|nr:MAG: aldehyde dehydrogenase family protein [Phycisphaeraceae bacterium]
MPSRLTVTKTYKLYIGGDFPRSESGRSLPVHDLDERVVAHIAHASRKDLRNAVVAARKAVPGWMARTGYNRGQIIYRMAEMLEGKADEFITALMLPGTHTKREARAEVEATVDRLVAFAGWTDKFSQVLGCHNPVAGPYYNFTVPEATGLVAAVAPDEPGLLALVSLIAPPLAAGNAIVAVSGNHHPIAASILGEVLATSDLPAGVVNILTGNRAELLPWISEHRDIDAVHAADLPDDEALTLRRGMSENIKRVRVREVGEDGWFDADLCTSPWWIEPFIEMKTIWHPAAT